MLSIFPGQDALKEKTGQHLRNRIFKADVDSIDKLERDPGMSCYSSTNPLLTLNMGTGEITVKFAKNQAALDV